MGPLAPDLYDVIVAKDAWTSGNLNAFYSEMCQIEMGDRAGETPGLAS